MNPFTPEEIREAQALASGERRCRCGGVFPIRTHPGGARQGDLCVRCRKREEKRRLYAERLRGGLNARGRPLKGGNGAWW